MKKIGRVANDSYQTPVDSIIPFLKYVDFRDNPYFLEPCKGAGNIYDLIDLPEEQKFYCEIEENMDYMDYDYTNIDIIITNPPYSKAFEFLKKSVSEADDLVAYLLRINFFGSGRRKEFWNANKPTHLFPLSKRPSFVDICKGNPKTKLKSCGRKYTKNETKICECGCKVGSGTDASEYAWFVWDFNDRIKADHWLEVL